MAEHVAPVGAGGESPAETILVTDRLLLRPFREADLEAYAGIVGDEETMRFLGARALDREDAWRHLALLVGHTQLLGFGLRAVEERDSGEVVGRVGLWFPAGWPDVEVSWLVRRDRWGRGYATEAATAVRDHGFQAHGIARLVSFIDPGNAASERVAEKLGAQPEAALLLRGRPVVSWRHQPPESLWPSPAAAL